MVGIYKIINPKNKIYIGQSVDIKKRWNQYNILDKFSIGSKIKNSLEKYGFENHQFEILEECKLEELDERETYWKKYYLLRLDWKNVLFHRIIDGRGGKQSEETKNLMSKIHQEYLTKPEILEKRLINCKNNRTFNSIQKIIKNTNWGERNKKLKNPRKRYKKFEKYSLNNALLGEYQNINDILKEFNNPKPQNLYACLKGTYKTWMGYKWKGY